MWVLRGITLLSCLALWIGSNARKMPRAKINLAFRAMTFLYTAEVLIEVIVHHFSVLFLIYYLVVFLSISYAYSHPKSLLFYLIFGFGGIILSIFFLSSLSVLLQFGLGISFIIAFTITYQNTSLIHSLKKKHQVNLAFMLEILGETADGLVVLNENRKLVSANMRACEILGVKTPETLIEIPFHQFIDLNAVSDLSKGQSREVFMQTLSGRPIFVEIALSPVQGENEEFRLLRLTDISKYKQKEEQILRTESTIKSVLESSQDSIWVQNKKGEIVASNHRFKHWIYQETGQKFTDESPSKLLVNPKFLTEAQWQSFYQSGLKGESITHEALVRNMERNSTIQVSFNPVKQGKEVIGVSVFLKDITQQKETQAMLEGVLQGSLSGIFVLNAMRDEQGEIQDFRLGLANEAAEEFFKQPIASLTGKRLLEALPEVKAEGLFAQFKEVVDSGLPLSIEHQLKNRNGDVHWLQTVAVKLGEGLAVTFDDFTDRKRAELQLIENKKLAEQESKSKADFLASMSHEIRTPMNAVIGMAGLLKETELSSEQEEYVNIVDISGQNLLTVINDILDFSKIESGKLTLEKQPLVLEKLVLEVFSLLRQKGKEKGLSLSYEIAKGVPHSVVGDITRLRQILINLINNALKFTKKGGVSVHISARKQFQKFEILFSVKDTGIGIPKARQNRLFQSYSQVDSSTSRKYGGTGLGLLICKNLVELMEGSIGLESKEGSGSTFYFTIRANQSEQEDQAVIIPKQNPWEIIEQVPKSLRILVAEDNPINQKVALRILQKLGLNAKIAPNGLAAFQMVKSEVFDLVFMDMQMPEMDGLEATEKIRALPIEISLRPRIIAMTANAMQGDRERCIAAGMDDYISKPIQLDKVASILAKWFEVKDQASVIS